MKKRLIRGDDDAPFIFGRLAAFENFTDREKDTALLISNFRSLINTIIISPRRWGKSSLVNKVTDLAPRKDPKLRVCCMDLFNVRSEEHFYEMLAKSVLGATSSKWEEMVETAKKFFSRLVPKIVLGGDVQGEVSLSFDWEELKANPDEVLDLAENIAVSRGLKIVVCIDEFQNIAEFDNPEYFQKRLRSHWQRHQNVAYCLYGSKRHLMMSVFADPSMPFYKFGDLLFLEKIDTPSFVAFIIERFGSTGKRISAEQATMIVERADNHPYYVQQLAQQVWLRTRKVCREDIVVEAHESLVRQLSLLFAINTEALTTNQIYLLHALVNEEKSLTSQDTLKRYRLVSSGNVTRSRKSLIDKDVLDEVAGKISFQDPMYRHWLKTTYFAGAPAGRIY